MIIQFLVAMVATAAFSVLYSVPRKNILPGAVAGGVGWIIYFTLEKAGADISLLLRCYFKNLCRTL